MIDPILNENLRRQRLWWRSSGYFELYSQSIKNTSYTKNMYSEGSFKDETKYHFINIVSYERYHLTMLEMANYSKKMQWHKGSWTGTRFLTGKLKKRGIIRYLGK